MFLDANRFLSKQRLIQDDLGGSKLVLKFNELLHCGSIKCILLQFTNIQRKQNLRVQIVQVCHRDSRRVKLYVRNWKFYIKIIYNIMMR